jgi:hypothetical protein
MRAFMSVSSLITMSVLTGTATDPAGEVVVVAAAVAGAGAAAVTSLTGALGPVSAPVTSGNSTRAVSIRLAVTGCCAKAVNGASPKQTSATAGTAFQGFLLIQPLTFTQNVESGYE